MKVVILCGGFGMRLREETEFRPKPMVEIGGHPILWHIMKTYASQGFTDFVLCLGYKGEMIKEYFLQYRYFNSDFSLNLKSQEIKLLREHRTDDDWSVTLVDTGIKAMTGARVKKVKPYVEGSTFMLTYGDAVTDIDLRKLLGFHRQHGRIGTVTAVSPPSRYGELAIDDHKVVTFLEKPSETGQQISGGYFVFERDFFDYLDDRDDCVLERDPLERLAKEGQLMVYEHRDFWQCMDTYRDYQYLQTLWAEQRAHWKLWAD